jgi:hypothetical protein
MFLKPGTEGIEICGNPSCRNSKPDFRIGVPAHLSLCVESPQRGFDPPGGPNRAWTFAVEGLALAV